MLDPNSLLPIFLTVTNVNLLDVPYWLGVRLGIGTFAGGVLASAILTMAFVLPTALITRRSKTGWLPELIMGFLALSLSVAMSWLPYVLFFFIALIIALMFAGTMRNFITGEK